MDHQVSPDDPATWKLPQNLVDFLRVGKQFECSDTEGAEFVQSSTMDHEYNPSETEAGVVVLKKLEDLS